MLRRDEMWYKQQTAVPHPTSTEMKIGIFGASGMAREVADVAAAAGARELVFIDQSAGSATITGVPVTTSSSIAQLTEKGFQFTIGIGNNAIRQKIASEFADLPWCSLVHPSATFGRGQREALERGRGTVVMSGVSFTNGSTVGDFCVFNPRATIAHDCILENFVYVSPGANVSGNVHLCEGVLVGTGASLIHGKAIDRKLRVGRWAVIGAGAAVVSDVPDGVTVAGVPAKPLVK